MARIGFFLLKIIKINIFKGLQKISPQVLLLFVFSENVTKIGVKIKAQKEL